MKDAEKREAARKFHNKWNGKGNEDQDGRTYWIEFLSNVVGMENVTDRVEFEKKVIVEGHTKKIDVYIPETHVLIEQKSYGKALDKKIPNSGDIDLTPYEQAKRYNDNLPYDEKAKWIITSNFSEIWVYDMNMSVPKPEKFSLEQIPSVYNKFDFLVNKKEQHISHEIEISIEAGKYVGLIYDALTKQYINPDSEESLRSLNVLCVRLVFCLYAEDAHIFGMNGHMFHDYLNSFATKDLRKALIELFKILNTPEKQRDRYDTSDLMKFPYVNGGLFEKEDIEIPNFTDEIREILLSKASDGFDWSDISPTIFGAVFESTLNPETRRSGGMHYTSIENIHKVIDPLFLDELKEEFEEIRAIQVVNTKKNKLEAFQEKLASLSWLDPAAGSGNFLTETFLSIRKLENQVIRGILDCKKGSVEGQIVLGEVTNPIKVDINQFYGIEINDFAVTVAKTALWIAESQMMKETEAIIHQSIDFLPLKTNANIVEGNALRLDWEEIVSKNTLRYIISNPPFNGTRTMSKSQKADVAYVFGKKWKALNSMDYVSCWYKKAADFIANTNIHCGFVSTNSIVQGEQVPALWKPLLEDYGLVINYAYQTFVWNSEAITQAKVHCVIIGFSCQDNKSNKLIISDTEKHEAKIINAYLNDAPIIFVERQNEPICDVPEIYLGCTFNDNNNLIMDLEEKNEFLSKYPYMEKYIRPYVMGKDFINRKPRFCFWLKNANPSEIKKCDELTKRIEAVREFRLTCKNDNTLETAETPTLPSMFRYYNRDDLKPFIAIPKVSSQRRRYVPMEVLPADYIAGDKIFLMPDADLYCFGILTSNVHMAWMRVLCGRLKSDYSYSSTIVYNTLPWPNPTEKQKEKIENSASGIIEARNLYPDSSLADLYDPLTMPIELLKAHQENDRAVMEAYGFNVGTMSEEDCVAELMKMYQGLTKTES